MPAHDETTHPHVEEVELDVRPLRKPDKHPTIFTRYDELAVGSSFVLVNDHDPVHLHEEFETELPGSYQWEYLSEQPRDWRVRITKITSTALPRVLINSAEINDLVDPTDARGVLWKLTMRERDLDSNIVSLPPGGGIDAYDGPDLDVLIHILAGQGRLTREAGVLNLQPGAVLWLPRRSRRQFDAGPQGLRYLTVHQRRQSLVLDTSRARRSG
ncbi:MAG: DUF2249 domain-containing protein [Ornithinimicrobium sp.]